MRILALVLAFAPLVAGATGHAEPSGDPDAGATAFGQCAACHNVVTDAGDVLAGGADVRTGPNLYGVAGRLAGSRDDFTYSPGFKAMLEAGVTWDEETFAAYIADPTGFIQAASGDPGAHGAMEPQSLSSEASARDIFAYLASLSE